MGHEQAAELIERVIDAGAAAILAVAVGFACTSFLGSFALGLVTGIVAGLLTWFGLRRLPSAAPMYPLPDFAPKEALFDDARDELLLTQDMRIATAGELLLDDILEEIGPDARVVRLFATPALPTAGQLGATIDRHLRARSDRLDPPDASEALSDALANLRRSLR